MRGASLSKRTSRTLERVFASMAVELPGASDVWGSSLLWEEDMCDATCVAELCPGERKEDEEHNSGTDRLV